MGWGCGGNVNMYCYPQEKFRNMTVVNIPQLIRSTGNKKLPTTWMPTGILDPSPGVRHFLSCHFLSCLMEPDVGGSRRTREEAWGMCVCLFCMLVGVCVCVACCESCCVFIPGRAPNQCSHQKECVCVPQWGLYWDLEREKRGENQSHQSGEMEDLQIDCSILAKNSVLGRNS